MGWPCMRQRGWMAGCCVVLLVAAATASVAAADPRRIELAQALNSSTVEQREWALDLSLIHI